MREDRQTKNRKPSTRTRWYQFRLRTLLIVVTLFAVVCSWATCRLRALQLQHETALVFVKAGVPVTTEPGLPGWIEACLPETTARRFDRVVELDLFYIDIEDSHLALLPNLPYLRKLQLDLHKGVGWEDPKNPKHPQWGEDRDWLLDDWKYTEAGLRHLETLTSLRSLRLTGVPIDGWGLDSLRNMKKLRSLELGETEVTDGALPYLYPLESLEVLQLYGTPITDDGLAHIAKLKQLEVLILDRTAVTDAGLAQLVGLSNLRVLHLRETAITDRGLSHVGRLTALKELNIGFTEVKGPGLAHLRPLTRLQHLDLAGTSINDSQMSHMPPLPSLQYLRLHGTDVSWRCLKHLTGSPNLKDIRMFQSYPREALDNLRRYAPKCEIN